MPKQFVQSCTRKLRALVEGDKGAVAIQFALISVCIISLTGVSIDFSYAVAKRAIMQEVADASVLAVTSNSAITNLPADYGLKNLKAAFSAFVTRAVDVSNITSTPTVTYSNNILTATVSWTATTPAYFSNIVGISQWTITGSSTASATPPPYLDIFLLLDASPSMGIGATATDIAAMELATGCAFACHSPSSGFPGYHIPDVPGTTLRLDVLKSATQQLINSATSTQKNNPNIRLAGYTFNNAVSTLADVSASFTNLSTQVSNIALPTTAVGTQVGDSIYWMGQNKISTSGDGSTQAKSVKYLFVITDGVEDIGYGYSAGKYDNYVQPVGYWNGYVTTATVLNSACQPLKDSGVTIAILYTNYVAVDDFRYTDLVLPLGNSIQTSLQACASPGYFWQANTPGDITSAMQTMFQKATSSSARLTK